MIYFCAIFFSLYLRHARQGFYICLDKIEVLKHFQKDCKGTARHSRHRITQPGASARCFPYRVFP
ncbi:hypothetical protein AGRO_0226 [Agrobacterium sp. ATCC 31749]|nr:hypothetical protein AGRO_0226 [Agrobacterium sp. ATCC 31749]